VLLVKLPTLKTFYEEASIVLEDLRFPVFSFLLHSDRNLLKHVSLEPYPGEAYVRHLPEILPEVSERKAAESRSQDTRL